MGDAHSSDGRSDGPSDVRRDAVMGTGTTANDSQDKYQAAF